MKVVILAGGYGTRLSEETDVKPKPMVEIGGKPILWHIMKIYSFYGFHEFIILLGYKGYCIKEYFANYYLHQSNVTFNIQTGEMEVHSNKSEPWKVTLLDTGINSMTGERIRQAQSHTGNESFMLTYGDGLSNINIPDLLNFHKTHGKIITLTSVQTSGRFGMLHIEKDNNVSSFQEKIAGDGGWINAGFFVCNPEIFDYLQEGKNSVFEEKPLSSLAKDGEMAAYKHTGFWQCMDTLRDKNRLLNLWHKDQAPWKIW